MNLIRGALIGLLVLGAAKTAAAQDQEQKPSPVNVSRLPIDLDRIHRDLRQAAATETDNHGLKIRYRVDVYGEAPPIEIFTKQDNLTTAPAPYGAPTHQDMINAVTPIYLRPGIMDFGSLFRWLSDKANRK